MLLHKRLVTHFLLRFLPSKRKVLSVMTVIPGGGKSWLGYLIRSNFIALMTWAPALPFLPWPGEVNSRRNPHRATNFSPPTYPALSSSFFLPNYFFLLCFSSRLILKYPTWLSVALFLHTDSRIVQKDKTRFLSRGPDFPSLSSLLLFPSRVTKLQRQTGSGLQEIHLT